MTDMAEPLSKDQAFIRKLTDIVLANLEDQNFGVEELASKAGLPRYTLIRKLKDIGNKTINQFIREVRLQKAKELLQKEDHTASEVAFLVGFSSPAYFNKCFHEYFGFPPGEADKPDSQHSATAVPPAEPIALQQVKYLKGPPLLVLLLLLLGVGTAGYLLYSKYLNPAHSEDIVSADGRISIAVMPFYNMTHDTSWRIWQGAIQECLIASLSNNKELKVRQQESINALLQAEGVTEYASLTPVIAGRISQKLDATLFVYGSIKQAGSFLRLDAIINNTKSNEVIQSFTIARPFKEADILGIIDTISLKIKNFLLITKLIRDDPHWNRYGLPNTNSPEAIRYCMYGGEAFAKGDNQAAVSWYLKSLAADSNYFAPMQGLSSAYANLGMLEQDYQWVTRYYNKRKLFSLSDQLWASWAYAFSFETLEKSIEYLEQIRQMDDQSPNTYYLAGITYNILEQYNKAIPELEKNLEICRKWGKDFMKNNSAYAELGKAYHKTGQYKKEKKIYKLALKYIPDDPPLYCMRAILALSQKDTVAANQYFEKYTIIHRQRYPKWESEIPFSRACIYSEAGYPDKAEEYLRKTISMDTANPERLYYLAQLYIQYNRKLGDVQALMDHAMKLSANKVDYYRYMDTKGWGLYKQGRYREALVILQKAWDSAPFKLNTLAAHLQQVKNALAGSRH